MTRSSGTRSPLEPNLDVEPGLALHHLAARWRREVDGALKPIGMTHRHYAVLSALVRAAIHANDAVSQRAIAREADLDEVTISRTVHALEQRGWVSRNVDGEDARMWRLMATTSGRRQLGRAASAVDAVTRTFFCEDAVRRSLRALASAASKSSR